MDEDTIVTLIGVRMAKPGTVFEFRGRTPDCEGCKLNNTCLNLDLGGHYKIVEVRDAPPLDCAVHDKGVQAVEVVEAPWTVLLESRMAREGLAVTYEPIACSESDCDMFDMCQRPGPIPGNRYIIINVVSEPEGECAKGLSLKIVEMKK
ncbi:MAG: UPF0179 family protein [ANME-2 cluster archaeon]|nr:UPF0179 family protein [ANME-2 cluster archaeon]